jgi:hypothetical protein
MQLQAKTDDFIRLFEEKIGNFTTHKDAYEAVEREHVSLTGERRYTDYETFRGIRERKIRNRQSVKM